MRASQAICRKTQLSWVPLCSESACEDYFWLRDTPDKTIYSGSLNLWNKRFLSTISVIPDYHIISPSALMSATKLRYYTLEHLTWLDRRSIYSSTWADATAANRRMGRCQVSLSVVHTYIAPSLSVCLTPRNTKARLFFFYDIQHYQGAPAHARNIHTLWIKFKDTCIHPGQPEFPMPGTPSPTQPSTHQRRQNQTVHGKLQKKKKKKKEITEIKQICCSQEVSSQMTQNSQLCTRNESSATSTSDQTKPRPKLLTGQPPQLND